MREGLREDGSVELADIEICKVDKTARLPVPWDAAPGTDPMYAVSQWPTRAMYARRRAVRAQSGVRAEVMGGLCGDKSAHLAAPARFGFFFEIAIRRSECDGSKGVKTEAWARGMAERAGRCVVLVAGLCGVGTVGLWECPSSNLAALFVFL